CRHPGLFALWRNHHRSSWGRHRSGCGLERPDPRAGARLPLQRADDAIDQRRCGCRGLTTGGAPEAAGLRPASPTSLAGPPSTRPARSLALTPDTRDLTPGVPPAGADLKLHRWDHTLSPGGEAPDCSIGLEGPVVLDLHRDTVGSRRHTAAARHFFDA